MKQLLTVTGAILTLLLGGCDRDPMSQVGFRLPPGDAIAGRESFLYMQCHQCHTVYGEELPEIPFANPPYVVLGGPVTRVRTYGQLITAIINPSHELAEGYAAELVSKDGESNMYDYNGYMTVRELIDIVMFLQPHYDVVVPDYRYRDYRSSSDAAMPTATVSIAHTESFTSRKR